MRLSKIAFACIYEALGPYVNKSKIEQERKSISKWRFYVIFRIVKKQLGFVGKSNTTSDELKK